MAAFVFRKVCPVTIIFLLIAASCVFYLWNEIVQNTSSVFFYPERTIFEETKEGYVVWSPSCRIPNIDPYDHSILSMLLYLPPITCSKTPLLTSLVRESNGNHTLVLLDDNKHYYVGSNGEIKCYYSLITRKDFPSNATKDEKVDDAFRMTEYEPFSGNVTFSKDEQFLMVRCKAVKEPMAEPRMIYNNIHAFVRRNKSVEEKIKNYTSKSHVRPLSIYLIGVDSVSRINLIRSMRKTYKHISKDWIEMKGYHKIGGNTFPNLLAVLTGMTRPQIEEWYWNNTLPLDNIPFIWKNFSDIGYVTGYAEDEPKISSFNHKKIGFLKAPTDHYIRPCMLAADKYLSKRKFRNMNVCLGPTATTDLILDYLIDFSIEYKDHPTFSLFWINNFGHDDVNGPLIADKSVKGFFERLEKTDVFNHSLVIFLSGHGMRFGPIQETYTGWMEERLPFLFFHLPDWWKQENRDKYRNLLMNRNRLSSPYDLHLTLKELLGAPEEGTPGCPNCTSLFNPLPWNRTCGDSGINLDSCACSQYQEVKHHHSAIKAMANILLNELNQIVSNFPSSLLQNGSSCAFLTIKRIMSVKSKVYPQSLPFDRQEYVILIQTLPGEAIFESTIQDFQIVDSINRLNYYGNQSKCVVKNAYLNEYCFCQYENEVPLKQDNGHHGSVRSNSQSQPVL